MLVEFGFAIWGGYELYNNVCESLTHTNLWMFGKITFILQLVIGLIILSIPVVIAIMSCCDSKTTKDPNAQPIIEKIIEKSNGQSSTGPSTPALYTANVIEHV